jgi:GTP:adenosylcobinamide-phosphate guanylyltransferase
MQTAMQTQFKTVSNLLTFVSTEVDENVLLTEFTCNVDVTLAGDSIWDCTLEKVTITGVNIVETFDEDDGDIYIHIGVTYNVNGNEDYEGSWRLYTDSGFADAVGKLLLTDVSFTEQGMQEDNYASMEL